MRPIETATRLAGFERRSPGSDAERRAARWLALELTQSGFGVRVETFWCRPTWALGHAWHLALAAAGSLVSVSSPRVGGALVLAALVFIVSDALLGISPGRRLSPERASQNVVAGLRAPHGATPDPVRLIVTANYDAGPTGVAYRARARNPAARLRGAAHGLSPGWLGWVSIAIIVVLATAILRLAGHKDTGVGVAQLIATVGLIIALALLIDIALSTPSPAAGDNASGSAVALALLKALQAAPPRNLLVELVLQGAGDASGIGLRRYLRARQLKPADTVVLAVAATGRGHPCWYASDGQLVPLHYFGRLREMCATIAAGEPHLDATSQAGRGATPALPARVRRLPAIAIGCVDEHGLIPRSHQQTDTLEHLDEGSLDRALQFGLMLIDAIDASLAQRGRTRAPTATPA
jgi:hypothetical protein